MNTDNLPTEEAIAAARDALQAHRRAVDDGIPSAYPQWAADVLKRVPVKMINYVCPTCNHGGAHPDNAAAPLCDRCNYTVTMVRR